MRRTSVASHTKRQAAKASLSDHRSIHMKNIFVGLIAICSSFVLANFGFGQAVSYTDISFNGYNGPEYEYDSGIVEGPTEHIAGVPGPSVLSGFASASFGTGYVKVSAQASDNTPIGYTASLTTTAVAFYVDTWTPVAGPYGSPNHDFRGVDPQRQRLLNAQPKWHRVSFT